LHQESLRETSYLTYLTHRTIQVFNVNVKAIKAGSHQVFMLPTWVHRAIDTCVLPHRNRFMMKHSATGYPHVALLFKGRKLLAMGQNRIFRRGPYSMIHAECDAIRAIGLSQLRDTTLVVVRLGPTSLLYSKPCRTCTFYIQKCMREYGLRGCLHS
jgi:hypothetical protein